MKLLITGILMLAASSTTYAQSTCMSRCEATFGQGESQCPKVCEGMDDRVQPKKKGNDAEAEAAFAAGAASTASKSVVASSSAATSASTPKKESVAPKESKPAPGDGKPGK